MKSKRVMLLGGKNNRRIVHVLNGRTVVVMPVQPVSETFAAGLELGAEVDAPEIQMERYVKRFFRCGDFKFSWWCLNDMNPQECLICFCYPWACNEIVSIRRMIPQAEKHNAIPIPHGWKNQTRRDPVALLDRHSIVAVDRYNKRHSN